MLSYRVYLHLSLSDNTRLFSKAAIKFTLLAEMDDCSNCSTSLPKHTTIRLHFCQSGGYVMVSKLWSSFHIPNYLGWPKVHLDFSVTQDGKTQTNFLANPIQMRLCTFTWAYRLIKFSVLLNAFSNLYSPLESFRFPYKTTPAFAWHPFPSLLETMCLFIISINCVISRMIYK